MPVDRRVRGARRRRHRGRERLLRKRHRLEVDGPRANVVRVLHDDGTMALYVHLNWNTIRVVPGQRVRRGEYLADSGNTGFTTGPHLHFVVQRNARRLARLRAARVRGTRRRAVDVVTGETLHRLLS